MKRTWIGMVLALAMAVALTGCSGRDTNNGTTTDQNGGSAGQNGGSSISQDIGAADDRINGNVPDQSGMANDPAGSPAGSGTYTGRTGYTGGYRTQHSLPEQRSGENPFVRDGRYRAYDNGKVDGRINPDARDFTQSARDMLRDAGKAVGDAGRSIGNAAADMGRGVTGAVRSTVGE